MTDIDIDAIRQRAVDDFNALYLVGAWVRYWPGTRNGQAKTGQTITKAELRGGTPVVFVSGYGTCVALTHVDVIPDQPDGIEDDSHDLPKLAGATERVGDYITATGDGIYDVIDGHPLYARDIEALRRAADHVWAGEQLRDELAEVREQLTAANRRADGLRADERSRGRAALTEYRDANHRHHHRVPGYCICGDDWDDDGCTEYIGLTEAAQLYTGEHAEATR